MRHKSWHHFVFILLSDCVTWSEGDGHDDEFDDDGALQHEDDHGEEDQEEADHQQDEADRHHGLRGPVKRCNVTNTYVW